jgi:hypothetical protein
MPCERAEQPLSRNAFADTGTPAPMEIMMAGPPEDICLLAGNPQSWGYVAALELPRVGSGSPSRGDTWWPQSCPETGAGARVTGTRGGPGAAPSQERELESRGHVAALELPRAGSGSSSHGDTWRPQSCPEL